jgi:hypothetical protein
MRKLLRRPTLPPTQGPATRASEHGAGRVEEEREVEHDRDGVPGEVEPERHRHQDDGG